MERLNLLIAILFLGACAAMGQTPVTGGTCSSGTQSCTVTVAVTAGYNIIAVIGSNSGVGTTFSTPTDSSGDSFTPCMGGKQSASGANLASETFCATAKATAASEVITLTASSSVQYMNGAVEVYSGGFVNIDQTSQYVNNSISTALTSGATATTTTAGELLIGTCFYSGSGTFTAGSGWAADQSYGYNDGHIIIMHQVVSAVGTYAATGTISVQGYSICNVGTFYGTPVVNNPVLSVTTGTYNNIQSVTISDTTTGAIVCYTTDGSTPTATTAGSCSHGGAYSSALSVNTTGTIIEALGTKTGGTNSSVVTATYTLTAAAPTYSPTPGNYSTAQTITLTTATSPASVYYCQDTLGTCIPSTLYTTPITQSTRGYIRTQTTETGFNSSAVISGQYTIGASSNSLSQPQVVW